MIVIFVFTGRNEVAKVMFLQASVCPQGLGVSASVHAGIPHPPGADTPWSGHPLGADTPLPGSRHTPRSRHPPEQTPPGADPLGQTPPEQTPTRADTPAGADTPARADTPPASRHPSPPRDTATAADGTHSPGMHSCFINIRSELTWYYQNGASNIYPDVWDEYLEPIPEVSLIIVCCDAVWFA